MVKRTVEGIEQSKSVWELTFRRSDQVLMNENRQNGRELTTERTST